MKINHFSKVVYWVVVISLSFYLCAVIQYTTAVQSVHTCTQTCAYTHDHAHTPTHVHTHARIAHTHTHMYA